MRVDDRLVGQHDASLIERGDDLVSGENVGTTLRLALDIRLIGEERTRLLLLGAVESFLRARKHLVHIGGMARRGDPPIVPVTETGPAEVMTTLSRIER